MEALVILGAAFLLMRQNGSAPTPELPKEIPTQTWDDKRIQEWANYAAELAAKGKLIFGGK